MIILDTNVISALMSKSPDMAVISWLDNQPRVSVWITSITILEVRFGLQILPASKKRNQLYQAFEKLLEQIDHRVAPFDLAAAQLAGDLMAARKNKGRPGNLRDTMIAGIVLAHRATLATRNTWHFRDISAAVINPWIS